MAGGSKYVKVPRAVANEYEGRPWSEVIDAAERRVDGLRVAGPRFQPFPAEQPKMEPYATHWAEDRDHVFLRCSDLAWTPNLTLWSVQCW